MAVNSNPYLTVGQAIPADVLKLLLAGQGPTGQFAPSLSTVYDYQMQGTGEGGDMQPFNPRQYIYQPRNVSTWGGSDTADVWDSQGNYIGESSGAPDLRSLARVAAAGAGGYYGGQALAGAGGTGAAGGGITGGSGLTAGGSAGYGSIGAGSGLGGTGVGLSVTPGMTAAFTTPELAAMGAAGGSALGAGGAGAGAGGSSVASGVLDAVGGAKGAAGLLGAVAGAASSKDQQATSSKDPWAPAQPFLQDLLKTGQGLLQGYTAKPFSDQQLKQYGQIYGLLDQQNQMMPGLLSQAQALGNFRKGR